MKVLYDHQSFTGAKYGGVARYFYDLMYALGQQKSVEIDLSLVFSNNVYLQNSEIFKVKSFKPTGFTNRLFSHLNRLNSAVKVMRNDFDVFHPTFFNGYFLSFLKENKPFVITYHDVIPEKFSNKYAELDGFDKDYKQNIINKASKIIAVSENTKKDILDIFDVDASKIDVVHHTTHFISYKPIDSFNIETPEQFLLYVGNRDNYKNFDSFIKSVYPLLLKNEDLHIICAGNNKFTKDEMSLFNHLRIGDRLIHYPIWSDDVLYRLYQKAIAFVYPSLYEGFGIPILEAFACGCPVILSKASSFPEVAKNAAIYFNPLDSEEIASQIESVINKTELRLDLVKRGYERLKDFTPEKMANQTLDVYKSVLKK
ncbi:MAG: glycosyltransferase family 4 protein [Spirosomataceae bacterium]